MSKAQIAFFCSSLQYGLATYLRGVGPFVSAELPGRSPPRRNNQDFQGKNGWGLSGGHMRAP